MSILFQNAITKSVYFNNVKKLQIWKRGTPLKALDDCFVKADWEQETMRRQLTSIKLIAELWFTQKATKNTTTLPKKK